MKKLLPLLFFTLFYSNANARVIGSIINGVPVVSISNVEIQNQLNTLSAGGYSNILLLNTKIAYNPISSGFLIITFECNEPGDTAIIKNSLSIELSYDESQNEFKIVNGGRKRICAYSNCVEGCKMDSDGCTPCTQAEDPTKEVKCKEISSGWIWAWFVYFIVFLLT